ALLEQALAAAEQFGGWDFSWLEGRRESEPLPWSYGGLVRARLPNARALLDVDTGGGERLGRFAPLPPLPGGTEACPPNASPADERLRPVGVRVVHAEPDGRLPFREGSFDLAIHHHGGLPADELARIVKPGGWLVTQQVGSRNDDDLAAAL